MFIDNSLAKKPRLGAMLFVIALIFFFIFPPVAYSAAKESHSFNMVQAVNRALAQNFRIGSAESEIEYYESGRKGAQSAFGPSLSTSYGVTRQQHVSDDIYTWRFDVDQELFAGFSTLAGYQKAALQKDNAEAKLAQARIALVLEVQQNFLMYLTAEANVRSAQDSYNRLAEQLKVTTSFYEVGLRPRVEVLQAEVNVLEAEDLLLKNRNTVETQRVRLNTLLNIPPSEGAQYLGSLDYIPFEGNLSECLTKAYDQRPDMIMARKSVEIAEKDKTIAKSNYMPNVSATGSWYTRGDDLRASGGTSDNPKNSEVWSIGLSARLSLFESGRDYYNVQKAGHNITKLKADEMDLRQEVVYEVQSRLLDLDNAMKRIVVARKNVESANEAYRVAYARYTSQVGTSIDVLDAQAKLTSAEVSFTQAQADYLSALAAIYSAIGEENPSLQMK